MGMRNVMTVLAALWFSVPVALGGDKPKDPWRDFDLVDVRIEGLLVRYEKSLEPKLADVRKSLASIAKTDARTLADLKEYRKKSDEIIKQINKIVGLRPSDKQQAKQRKMFTSFLDITARTQLTNPKRKTTLYLIMNKSALAYARKGGKVPGCTYDRSTDRLTVDYVWFGRTSSNKGPPEDVDIVFPIDNETSSEFLADTLGVFARRTGLFWRGALVHELAEMTIVFYKLKPLNSDYRWFSDGFANAIAIHVLRRNLGKKAAADFKALYDVTKCASLAKDANLQYWLAPNHCVFATTPPLASEARLSNARYSFATHEAMRLIKKHGIGCVAKILNKACASKGDGGNLNLQAAIKQATGEDIAKRLALYQSFKTRPDGIDLYTARYKASMIRKDYQRALGALLRRYEIRDWRDMKIFDQAAGLLSRLGDDASRQHVLARAAVCKKHVAEWTRRSAEQNIPAAMRNLAFLYAGGIGVKKDLAHATKWFRKAALAGDPRAMFEMAIAYKYGHGVNPSPPGHRRTVTRNQISYQ